MSGGVQQSLFFLRLPDLKKLVCVTLSLQEEDEEPRSKQMKTCRELALLYTDVLASPALDSFTDITVVMATSFLQKGIIQVFAQRHRLQLDSPQCVLPGVLQCCLSYSLISRLAPSWNKAGLYLISGKNFLTDRGRMNAVSMELSTSEGQMCICIEANTVRLPPATLDDFNLPPLVLQRFCSDPDFILDPTSTGGTVWCHVLPSMKRGQIITVSRQLPRDGPFRTYRDLQNHWNQLYGYRLPDLPEEEVVYCSVYFRPVGDRLFTYPLSCIRLQSVQRCPRVDLQGALGSFLSDIRIRMQSVCGFPARLTSKPCYYTTRVNTAAAAQERSGDQVNLTSSCSTRLVLTQLPARPPPQTVRPFSWSQPPVWTSLSQQDRAPGFSQSQGGTGDKNWPLSSSSHVPFSSAPSSSFSIPALSLSTSSSVISSPPLPAQTPVNPAPKLVPIFKNKHPSYHINVALLRVQKQQQQSGGVEGKGRVTIPIFRKNKPTTAPPSSSASHPVPPPPTIPHFTHSKPPSSTAPQPSAGLSPEPESKPELIVTSKPEKLKSILKTSSGRNTAQGKTIKLSAAPPEVPPLPSSDVSSTDSGGVGVRVNHESKVKKSRAAVRDVDVEKMARSSELSKLNSATLLSWLKRRGVLVSAKHKKDELMLKVMACLAEA